MTQLKSRVVGHAVVHESDQQQLNGEALNQASVVLVRHIDYSSGLQPPILFAQVLHVDFDRLAYSLRQALLPDG